MLDWFLWNNTRCTTYGVHVLTQPEQIRPAERIAFTSVPGRSGSLTTLEGADVYDDFILSAECIIENTNRLSEISAWLRGSGTVTFANRQGGFYYARIVNQISFEKILRGNPHRSFAVNFRCQPFFYLTDVADITVNTSGTIITNPGSVFSEPTVKVTMSGNAQIIIGGTYFELNNINGAVTIDTPLMETHMSYGSKVWHSTDQYRRVIWQCNAKFKNADKCSTPHLTEDEIRSKFVIAFNQSFENKEETLAQFRQILAALADTNALETERTQARVIHDDILKKMELAIHMNATMALDQSAYQKDYDVLLEQAASAKAQVDGLDEVIAKKDKQRRKLLRVMSEIEKRDSLLSAFDEPLWIAIVEKVVVSTKELIFCFRDGTQRAVKRE